MPDASQLRTQIRVLQTRRRTLESRLLQPQTMTRGSLLERFLRAGSARRASPAYYLSRSQAGRSTLQYVKREDLATARRQCQAYRGFRDNLKQWRRLGRELGQLWKALLEAQTREP